MESDILLWIHARSSPIADAAFALSHEMGTVPFCTVLVVVGLFVAMIGKRRDEALLWIALGVSTYILQATLKAAFMRPRPALWVGAITLKSYAFPSGHAVASATFYPMAAYVAAERWPERRVIAYAAAAVLAFFIGFGRLYLGVHWPSDVLAGWTLGAGQTYAGIALIRRRARR